MEIETGRLAMQAERFFFMVNLARRDWDSEYFRFQDGNFVYVDVYMAFGKHREGRRFISYYGVPIWFMYYEQRIADKLHARNFYREAIMLAYREHQFHGGRGPSRYYDTENGYMYSNSYSGTFSEFIGSDYVVDMQNNHSISTEYCGGMMPS